MAGEGQKPARGEESGFHKLIEGVLEFMGVRNPGHHINLGNDTPVPPSEIADQLSVFEEGLPAPEQGKEEEGNNGG